MGSTNMQFDVMVLNLEDQIRTASVKSWGKSIQGCSPEELYTVMQLVCKRILRVLERNTGEKKIYYVSAEFMVGRMLVNNLMNLGIYDAVEKILQKYGKSLSEIGEYEPEPHLGFGSPGRLAACMMDSIATLGLNGEGIGLYYHAGAAGKTGQSRTFAGRGKKASGREGWENLSPKSFEVDYGSISVTSRLYNLEMVGYMSGRNRLRLFDVAGMDTSRYNGELGFDAAYFKENPPLFLHPDDTDATGRKLRLYQQYFLASSAAQLILRDMKNRKYDLYRLGEYAVIQINDTYPGLIIPELIRILITEKAMEYEGAIRAVADACAYTSHAGARAAMAWPAAYMEEIVPALMPVIRELDRRVRDRFEDPDLWIIDPEGGIHIDRLQIHYCSHVNGVGSSACTDGYRKFREIYPERFCFIANGISFRRWLTTSNRELAAFISAMIGDGYKRNPLLLEDLLAYRDDPETLAALEEIKYHARQELCRFLLERTGRQISPDAVFDMQIKPLQEDRRQLMNVLDVIHRYLRIRRGELPPRPAVFFVTAGEILTTDFARDLLHLMRVLQEVIDRDEKAAPYMKLVVISGCNVTWAEKLIPACDISEQIALASREACGTVNMKCMLNGAVTIGTDDGSNAMIRDLVGTDRTYLFGHRAEEIAALTEAGTYSPSRIYGQSETVREAVDFILSPDLLEIGDRYVLQRLYDRLTGTDPAMDLLDLEDYIRTRDRILADYEDRDRWQRMMLVNIARAGGFSSDNTAEAYNERIWGLKREVRSRDWF